MRTSALCMLAAVLFAAGCGDASLSALSIAPPGAVAEYNEDLSNDSRRLRISQGLAFALECTDRKGKPCTFDGTSVADDTATVHRAYADLDQKVATNPSTGAKSAKRCVLVVVGRKVGHTTMRLVTGNGDVDVDIDVVAP